MELMLNTIGFLFHSLAMIRNNLLTRKIEAEENEREKKRKKKKKKKKKKKEKEKE
jgi:hypothetical protein